MRRAAKAKAKTGKPARKTTAKAKEPTGHAWSDGDGRDSYCLDCRHNRWTEGLGACEGKPGA